MGKDKECKKKTPKPYEWSEFTMRNLIKALRNAAAHRRFKAISNGGQITHINFTNSAGFDMDIPVMNLGNFVRELAKSALKKLG